MEGLKQIESIRAYCDYVETHLINVSKAWEEIQAACIGKPFIEGDHIFHSINALVVTHDLSKLSKEEFIPYSNNFFPPEVAPNPAEFKAAWAHHKEHNPHHWQNWVERETFHPEAWVVHCVCMVVDWVAMGYAFGDTAQKYYEKNKDWIKLPEEAKVLIAEIFKDLEEYRREE